MSGALTVHELDRIAGTIQRGPYDDYPEAKHRLYLGAAGLYLSGATLVVPDGPWYIGNQAKALGAPVGSFDPEVPAPGHPRVDEAVSERWRKAGLLLDQYGRPIHPDWLQLLADKRIGLPTGTGFFWRYGVNKTTDAGVYRRARQDDPLQILLIRRRKGGQWALPGGFDDKDDTSSAMTARREAGEETHLDAIGGTDEIILQNRPIGLRDTLHAWTKNTLVLLHGDQDYLFDTEPQPGDDAIDVGWFTREETERLDMLDSHPQYIDRMHTHLRAA